MAKTNLDPAPNGVLADLIAEAAECNADWLDVESNRGTFEISAMKGHSGIGIADIETSSSEGSEGCELWEELNTIEGKKSKVIHTSVGAFQVKVSTYDSFGETCYRVRMRKEE